MMKKSLPLRVIIITFIVLALPLFIDSFIFFKQSYNESIRDAKRILRLSTSYRTFALSDIEPLRRVILNELELLLEIPKKISGLPNADFNVNLEHIGSLMKSFKFFVLRADEKGEYKVVAASDAESVGTTFIGSEQLKRDLKVGSIDFIRYIYSREAKRSIPHLFLARKIEDESAPAVLMISSDIENRIPSLITPSEGKEGTIHYALLNQDSIIFASSDKDLVRQQLAPLSMARRERILETEQFGKEPLPPGPLRVRKMNAEELEFVFKHKKYIAYQICDPKLHITLMAYTQKSTIFGAALLHFLWIYTLYALVFFVGVSAAIYLTTWLSRPLRQLMLLMERVRSGDYKVRFHKVRFGYEINDLGVILNNTLDRLMGTMKRIEKEKVERASYERELQLGKDVQYSLFPKKLESLPGIEIAEAYVPASEVGGDFFDLFVHNNKLVLAVADTAGKGISACMYSLVLRSILRTSVTLFDNLGEIITHANKLFMADAEDKGIYATLFMGIYDPQTHLLHYYSCGNVPGIVKHPNGHLTTLEHTGMAMGIMPMEGVLPQSIKLLPGDALLFYTDGLVSAVNESGQMFRVERLKALLQQRSWSSAEELSLGITHEVKAFMGPAPQRDDITLLVVKIEDQN